MTPERLDVGPVAIAWTEVAADRSATADALLAGLVAEITGRTRTAIARGCPTCGGTDHGRPLARGTHLSASYTRSIAVVAAVDARHAASIGIDIEDAGERGILDDLTPLFAPDPPPDIAGWTRIEAVLKADGRGVRLAPSTVRFAEGAAGSVTASTPGRVFDVTTIPGPAETVISIAVERSAAAPG